MTETGQPVPGAVPPPGVLDEIDVSGIRVASIRAALELGVFPAIESGARDGDEIARVTECDPGGMRVLLEALGSFGLLRRVGDRYQPTPTAEAYLMPASPTCIADFVLSEMRARDHFTESVRLGRPARDVSGPDGARLWAAFALWGTVDWPTKLPPLTAQWAALELTPASVPGARVLDVGCGSGLRSLALVAGDPTASVLGIDWQPVIDVAERLASAMGVARQAAFLPGDATILHELDDAFDVVLFGFVLHYFDPPEITSILREARRLVRPAGRLVIVAPLAQPGDYEDPAPFLTAVWMLNVAPRGRVYALDDYSAMVTEAGFEAPARVEGTPWLHARPSP